MDKTLKVGSIMKKDIKDLFREINLNSNPKDKKSNACETMVFKTNRTFL